MSFLKHTLYFSAHAIRLFEYSPSLHPENFHFSIVPPIVNSYPDRALIRNICPTPPKYYLTLSLPLLSESKNPIVQAYTLLHIMEIGLRCNNVTLLS